MKTLVSLLCGLTLAAPIALHAEPAAWYQWRSKADGQLACSQTPLGPGWVKFDGPYRDARCKERKAVK